MDYKSDNNKTVKTETGRSKGSWPGSKQQLTDLILLLRPKQWTKNLLLFAGLIFSYNILQAHLVLYAVIAFIAFCLLSGCMYIINDLVDLEEDRRHPYKKYRPLAAGRVELRAAIVLLVTLLVITFTVAWLVNIYFFIISLVFLALLLSYSLWLKHVVILDVLIIAFGFLLRALAGAIAISVDISAWFLLCTLLLALFLALIKRRQESVNSAGDGAEQRKVLKHYPVQYLDQLISIVTAAAILGYSLYTFTASQTDYFMLTIPFVIYGIFRYLYLLHHKNMGENPEEVLLQDKPTLVNIIAWVLLSILILSLEHGGII